MSQILSISKPESYNGLAQAGVDLMPIIFENASQIIGKKLSHPYVLRHFTIFGVDGDVFAINEGFNMSIHNGSLSSAFFGWTDMVKIWKIVPQQDSQVEICYLR